jgi:predicted metal-binding membrane protein
MDCCGPTADLPIARRIASAPSSERVFFSMPALIFAGSAAMTIVWCASMSATGGMAMPGGWTMSMTWMRMAGQTWFGAAASFLGMWVVMMTAMMLPSLIPALRRYREAIAGSAATYPGRLAALVGLGYFSVWTAIGLAVFPLGAALAAVEMHRLPLARAVPIGAGVIVAIAGALQFTAWKRRHVAGWPAPLDGRGSLAADAGAAWRHGVRLGFHCVRCCANLMAILLVLGIMDLRVMALVTSAITAERLAPAGDRIARVTGVVVIGTGVLLIARAAVG